MDDIRLLTTEKVTINVNTVDLGYIDMLIAEGQFATRTEFVKYAVKSQLESQNDSIERTLGYYEERGRKVYVGIARFNHADLEEIIARGEKLDVVVVGLLSVSSDVSLDLIKRAVNSITVYGVCRCREEIKAHYNL